MNWINCKCNSVNCNYCFSHLGYWLSNTVPFLPSKEMLPVCPTQKQSTLLPVLWKHVMPTVKHTVGPAGHLRLANSVLSWNMYVNMYVALVTPCRRNHRKRNQTSFIRHPQTKPIVTNTPPRINQTAIPTAFTPDRIKCYHCQMTHNDLRLSLYKITGSTIKGLV